LHVPSVFVAKSGQEQKFFPGALPPDHHAIAVSRQRIRDLELREDRRTARAREEELLLAAELAAQRLLPRLDREIIGSVERRQPAGETRARGAALRSWRRNFLHQARILAHG